MIRNGGLARDAGSAAAVSPRETLFGFDQPKMHAIFIACERKLQQYKRPSRLLASSSSSSQLILASSTTTTTTLIYFHHAACRRLYRFARIGQGLESRHCPCHRPCYQVSFGMLMKSRSRVFDLCVLRNPPLPRSLPVRVSHLSFSL